MPSRPWLRWLVPLAAVLAIAATTLVAGSATADEKLPPRTAEQLLVDLQQAQVDGFSGTVEQTADLGIPALPGVSEHGSDVTSLLSGTHRLRVAYAAPDSSRVSLLGDLSESSVTRHGDDLWAWSSKDNTATHARVDKATADQPEDLPSDAAKTPQEAAQRILASADQTTTVATDSDVTVAGRAAYELVLRPKDTRSLISSVRIAIDGSEHVALRVQMFAGDRPDPVASIGFTEVDFTTPPASEFSFTPPAGATVKPTASAVKPATSRQALAHCRFHWLIDRSSITPPGLRTRLPDKEDAGRADGPPAQKLGAGLGARTA